MLAVLAIQSTAGAVSTSGSEVYGADLSATLDDSPDPVHGGNHLLLHAEVFNDGPDTAFDAQLLLELDESLALEDVTFDYDAGVDFERRAERRGEGPSCVPDIEAINVFHCSLGSIGVGDTMNVDFLTLVDDVSEVGLASTLVEASTGEQFDPVSENDTESSLVNSYASRSYRGSPVL